MAEVTGNIGGQTVELDNAATEATLKQLLAATAAMAKASGMNPKAQKDLEKQLKALAQQTQKASAAQGQAIANQKKLNDLAREEARRAAELAKLEAEKIDREKELAVAEEKSAEAMADVGRELVNLAVGASRLLGTMSGLGDSITSTNQALGSIPIVGGFLSSSLGSAAEASERVYGQFKELSSIGATFGGSFNEMINAAAGAGLTLEQFAGIIKQNGDSLAYLGGTTEQGARRFADLGKQMRQSGVGDQLLKMGFSTEQINSGMGNYIGILARTGRLQGKSNEELTTGAGKYLRELDALARITGTTREEKEKELMAIEDDMQLRAATATMTDEQAAQVRNFIAQFPKEYQKGAMDMLATGNMTTDEAIRMNMIMPQLSAALMEQGRAMKQGAELSQANADAIRNAGIDEAKERYKQTAGLVQFNRDYDNEFRGTTKMMSLNKDAMAKTAEEQAKLAEDKSQAQAIANFKQNITNASNEFTAALINTGALEAIENAFMGLAAFTRTIVVPAVEILTNVINGVTSLFSSGIEPILLGVGLALSPLIGAFKTLSFVTAPLGGIFAFLKPVLMSVVRLAGPIGLVITAILAMKEVVNYLKPAFEEVGRILDDIIFPAFSMVGTFLKENFMAAIEPLQPAFDAIGNILDKVGSVFDSARQRVVDFLRGFSKLGDVTEYLSIQWDEFKTAIYELGMGLREKFSWLPGVTKPTFEEKQELARQKEEVKLRTEALEQRFQQNRINNERKAAERQAARDKSADKREQDAKAAAEAAKTATGSMKSPEESLRDSLRRAGKLPGAAPTATAKPAAAMPVGEAQKNLIEQLKTQGINDPTAIANIMAQVQAESGFNPQSENLNYSGKKLFELYGAGNKGGNKVRFNTIEEANALAAKGPEAVGNVIYGGRMGNKEDEGFKYRGRGLIQLTGKDNYKKFGDLIGIDLVGNPDLANDPTVANKIAAAYFAEKQKKGVNLSDINAIGKAVGYAGGASETAKRAQLASGFAQQLGSTTPTTSSVVASAQEPAVAPSTPASPASPAPPPTKTASLNDVLKELAMLNSNVGELIAINSSAVNTARKQLSVQQSMTNDVFAA